MQSVIRNLYVIVVIFVFATPTTQSDCPPLHVFNGEAAWDSFGSSIASAGDVDNDGYDDIIVGAAWNDAGGQNAGRVYVFSGFDGDTLFVFTGEAEGDHFGNSVASAGDVNNDGYADLIVGAIDSEADGIEVGKAYVFSGYNGQILHVFSGEAESDQFGFSVATVGDVNNDDHADLIVGAPFKGGRGRGAGRVYVFSGLSGDMLYLFSGASNGVDFGFSVASAGDVNNDGYVDLIVGAPSIFTVGNVKGRGYVFSGRNGDTLHVFTGKALGDRFGWSVASAGDVNNDGYADLIVGAPLDSISGLYGGRSYVFSGLNGDTLHVFSGQASSDYFGYSVASTGDLDNDGYSDVVISAPDNDAGGVNSGRVYVFSGLNGDTLFILTGDAERQQFGHSVSSAGDVNNDGYTDLIVGVHFNVLGGLDAGRAYVFSGKPDVCCCEGVTGNVDCDANDSIDIADLTTLIDHLFIAQNPLCCAAEANIDGDEGNEINMTDVTFLIDHLFISLLTTSACQ